MYTASPVIVVPSGIVTPLPRCTRPPGSLAPTFAPTVPPLFTFTSRALRNGVAGQSQKKSVVVVVEVVGVPVVEGGAVRVVVVVVGVVVCPQPWTRKLTLSTWSCAVPVMIGMT